MTRWFAFLACCFALGATELPQIVVVGGPGLLWPQIVAEYQRRYPAQAAGWNFGAAYPPEADLIFAYHPTAGERPYWRGSWK